MNQKNWIVILVVLVVVLAGATVYFAVGNKLVSAPTNGINNSTSNSNATNIQNQPTDTFTPQSVNVLMWPDVKSFNLTNKTFEAKDLNTGKNIKVAINSSTKFYKIVYQKPAAGDYFDFQGFYSLMKNWEGPTWRFTLKGSTQNDGSIMASEIFYTIQ